MKLSAEVLPAHAGVILDGKSYQVDIERITRTCGGDPVLNQQNLNNDGYYPHMRG